jgi:hypothetical protein
MKNLFNDLVDEYVDYKLRTTSPIKKLEMLLMGKRVDEKISRYTAKAERIREIHDRYKKRQAGLL